MIYIITPCSRPFNIEEISKSIPKECTWVISFDNMVKDKPYVQNAISLSSPYTGSYGNPNRNFALDYLKDKINDDDWIYILDDDNIIHPDWYDGIKDKLSTNSMIHWGQCFADKTHRTVAPLKPLKGTIDTAQYMVRWGAVKNIRFADEYEADGIYANDCLNAAGSSFRISKDLCYFNFLRRNKYKVHDTTRVRLCMISMFKNDSKNIGKMLESVTPYIDYWIIQDNGSTDDSSNIIKEWANKYKIPGRMYKVKEGWVNFSWNQDYLLQTALKEQHCCDWIMKMDCNEILEADADFNWSYFWTPHHSFHVPYLLEGVAYNRAWIWNAHLPWKFEHSPTNYNIKLNDGIHGENFHRENLPLSIRMKPI